MWVPVDDLFAILRNQLLIATAVPCTSFLGNLQCIASLSESPAKSASKLEQKR
jgi:hypothetical protein